MDKSSINPVRVRILEKDYVIACPDGQQLSLLQSAKRVDHEMRRLRDTGKVMGIDRIAVIVAINLANELLNLQQSTVLATDDQVLHQQLQKLQDKMTEMLAHYETLVPVAPAATSASVSEPASVPTPASKTPVSKA